MTTIKIELPRERLLKLKALSERFGISTEELVRISVDDMLDQPEEKFQQAADYTLKKNAALYQRLAK